MIQITYITHDGEQHVLKAEPGISLMQLATSNGLPGIDGECGGALSCATCHVYVDESWLDKLQPPGQTEQDMLEFAEAPGPTSRLSCQIKTSEALDGMVVHVPASQ